MTSSLPIGGSYDVTGSPGVPANGPGRPEGPGLSTPMVFDRTRAGPIYRACTDDVVSRDIPNIPWPPVRVRLGFGFWFGFGLGVRVSYNRVISYRI